MMLVTLVHVYVKAEKVQEFIQATEANHIGSIAEPNNRRFDILQDAKDPTHFVLYEAYADATAAAAHKQTPHYLKWRETVAPMMARPREGLPFVGLYPESEG